MFDMGTAQACGLTLQFSGSPCAKELRCRMNHDAMHECL